MATGAGALEYSEADLAALHPSERAALLDDSDLEDEDPDLTPEEKAALAAIAAEEETEVLGDDPTKIDAATGKPKEAPTTPVTPVADEEDEDDRLAVQAATIKVVDKTATQTEIDKLIGDRDALAQKLQDGDLDFADYTKQTNAISDQLADLKADLKTADNEAARVKSAEQAMWDRQCDRFFKEHGDLYNKTGLRFQALNAAVMAIANKPENGSLSGTKILRMAHAQLVEEGLVPAAKTPVADGKKKPAGEKPQVPTLAGQPSAEISETQDETFKVLDNLPQDQLEAALAKMSEADQKRYLAG